MAVRLFNRLRHQATPKLPHFLSSRFLTPSHDILRPTSTSLHFRHFSDVTRPLPNELTSSAAKSPAFPRETESNINGTRVPIKSSLNEVELAKFSAIAETWWDSEGSFKPLHALNPTRLAFIRSTLCHHFRKDPDNARPFVGLNFIDVGCGGGILSEPLARMGATVTGIDVVDRNIKIARLHAESDPATSSIEYLCTTAVANQDLGSNTVYISALCGSLLSIPVLPNSLRLPRIMIRRRRIENLVEEQRQYDAVLALEVIEHVADPAEFCKSLAALTLPNGATLISTINRTMRAYATAIVAAEYILHWLPKGTHEWSKFLTPEELVLILQRTSVTVQEMAGFVYNPLSRKWLLSDDISVNFIAFGVKKSDE